MFNSPTIGKDGTIYAAIPFSTMSNGVTALNPDGSVKWTLETEHFLESTPMVAPDGNIYIGSFSETGMGAGMYSISSSGKINWHFDAGVRETMSTPSIDKNGIIYFAAYETGMLEAVNPDGTRKWNFFVGKETGASPTIGSDGTIYIGSGPVAQGNPSFYAINPDGSVKWSYNEGYTNSIISSAAINSEGNVFVGSTDGKLIAFGSKDQVTQEQVQAVEDKKRAEREYYRNRPLTEEEIDNTYRFEYFDDSKQFKEPLPGKQGHEEPKSRDSPFAQFIAKLREIFGN